MTIDMTIREIRIVIDVGFRLLGFSYRCSYFDRIFLAHDFNRQPSKIRNL